MDLATELRARHHLLLLSRNDADITDEAAIIRTIEQRAPEVVIHAAAMTGVDDCELHPDLAYLVNGRGTRNVALACHHLDVPMLYVSTDYVFDGEKETPYVESDPPNPLNVYGRSKLEGEMHVRNELKRYWIVRTSWLFGPHGMNFVQAILKQARVGSPLRVVCDQVGSPTYTSDLSEKLEEIITHGGPGVYQVSNQGDCSRLEFAREILRQEGMDPSCVTGISTSESDRPARRPKNSRLAGTRLAAEKMNPLPPWEDALRRYRLREASVSR